MADGAEQTYIEPQVNIIKPGNIQCKKVKNLWLVGNSYIMNIIQKCFILYSPELSSKLF